MSFAREGLGLDEAVPVELKALAVRGSDRTFFRLAWGDSNSCILVRYDPKRTENRYYADITSFLRSIGVPAPLLIRHDPERCLMLMEDLGGADLWSFRREPWEVRGRLYRKTLAAAATLHSFPESEFPSTRVKLMEPFGPELYRWEREYFKEHFVRGLSGIEPEPSFAADLERELSALAGRLCKTGQALVHRDLQSQNVMIRDEEPFFIDYQGMRFGSPFYDLASLLGDPYVELSDAEQDELLSFYYGTVDAKLDETSFRTLFRDASAERLMQALGAYGFLGITKGLPSFLDHIPQALRNLDRAASGTASLKRLSELVGLCKGKWQAREEGERIRPMT
jgi:N-acetylmuramate 1-kinase